MDLRKTLHTRVAKAKGRTVPHTPRAPTRLPATKKTTIGRSYERFLELPVAFVLAVLWVAGAVLLGSSALVVYLVGRELVRFVAGS